MKRDLAALVATALAAEEVRALVAVPPAAADIQIERTRDARHGDFACNVAMTLARGAGCAPRALAERIVAALPASPLVSRVEIAGPGFINFHVPPDAAVQIVRQALAAGPAFGTSALGAGRRVQVEFVSANPTGPLHIGHGRGAAYGAVIAALLEATGHAVTREYYINDAGRQVDILAVSVWLRYLELCGVSVPFPPNGYQADYVRDRARELQAEAGTRYAQDAAAVLAGLPPPAAAGAAEADRETADEARLDALIANARRLLGADYARVLRRILDLQLAGIRAVLERFGVRFDQWYSEQSLHDSGGIARALEALGARGHLYERDGALWFRATAFGDDKDRVLRRENGAYTYFAADVAYHHDKFERGFEELIDVWGADHHGYIPRIRAVLDALGHDPARLTVPLIQLVALYRGGEQVRMGKRSGSFVTLEELLEEVGVDAARFFYIVRKAEQHLEFDLDLAKSQSADNPVYYVQYAHARVCRVFGELAERGLAWNRDRGEAALARLVEPHEDALIAMLARYPEVIEGAALAREPHQLAQFLREAANAFHGYYHAHKFIVDDAELRDARLCLVAAARQMLANGLALLGVSAPQAM